MADSRPIVVEQPTERAQAFLRLADHHLDAAYRLARAILHDSTDAQDATHDAFEQAWEGVDETIPANTGLWVTSPTVTDARRVTSTLLPNGTVLVVGGQGDTGASASAELYHPGSMR